MFFFITDIALPVLRPRAHHCSSCCRCVLRPAPKILLIARINSTSQFVWRNPFQTNPAIQIESFKRAPLSKQRTKLFIATLCNCCLIVQYGSSLPLDEHLCGLAPQIQTSDMRSYVFLDATCVWLWGVDVGSYEVRLTWKLSFSLYTLCLLPHFTLYEAQLDENRITSDSVHRGWKLVTFLDAFKILPDNDALSNQVCDPLWASCIALVRSKLKLHFTVCYDIRTSERSQWSDEEKGEVQPGPWKDNLFQVQHVIPTVGASRLGKKRERLLSFFKSCCKYNFCGTLRNTHQIPSHPFAILSPNLRHFRLGLIAWFASLAVPWCFTGRSIQKRFHRNKIAEIEMLMEKISQVREFDHFLVAMLYFF